MDAPMTRPTNSFATSAFLQDDFARLRNIARVKFPVEIPFKYSLPTERWMTEQFGEPFVRLSNQDGAITIKVNDNAKWDWGRDTLYLCDDHRMGVFVTLYLKGR
jgi:hypothetical protein